MELTSSDAELLAAASDIMLRPFEHASPLKYLVAVSQRLEPLIGAFASMCGTRDPEGRVGLDSAAWPADAIASFAKFKLNDPGTERALSTGSDIATMRAVVNGAWNLFEQDPMVREWYKPRGVHDVVAYLLHWSEDNALATIELHGRTFGTARFGEEGHFLLTILQPSFRAGMRLLYTVGQLRETIARDMDALDVPLCVCSREGRIHHLSTAVRMILAADDDSRRIVDRIPDVAAQVAVEGGRRPSSGSIPSRAVHQVVTTSKGRYRLSAALATHSMHFGRTDVLVTVTRLDRTSPAGDLESLYALSARERQVAALLGRGLSNQHVGKTLGISTHTAKRHIERIFTKLGVRTRAAAAALIGTLGQF